MANNIIDLSQVKWDDEPVKTKNIDLNQVRWDDEVSNNPKSSPEINRLEQSPIVQYGKGAYESLPFVKGLTKRFAPEQAQVLERIPKPKGIIPTVSRYIPELVKQGLAYESGAGILSKFPILGGATGVGALTGAEGLTKGKGLQVSGEEGLISGATTLAGGKLISPLIKGVGNLLKSPSEKISSVISDLYPKAVKPTTSKGNFNLLQKSNKNIEDGIKSIVNNKENLSLGDEGVSLPQTLSHTSEAIEQTKNSIFNKYNDMQKLATGRGVTVSGDNLANQLDGIINNKSINISSPSTVEYAKGLQARLREAGELSPEELQNMIKGFNGRLNAYYRNPSPDQYGQTAVDALLANNSRKILDESIEKSVGPGYQALKKQYGALSSIEKDVARAAQRSSNIQNKGLIDFSDIFTSDQIVKGILSGNPSQVASGVGARIIKEYYKYRNNPDTNIKKMFEEVYKQMSNKNKLTN